MMKKIKLVIAIALGTANLYAQDTLSISKNDLLQKVTENNLQIKVAEKSFQSAKADYRQSNALFLPNINFSGKCVYLIFSCFGIISAFDSGESSNKINSIYFCGYV